MDVEQKVEDVTSAAEQSPKGEAEVKPEAKSADQKPKSDKPQMTPEIEKWVEREVHNRYTAKLAKDGDKVKTVEERLSQLETENQALKDERLEAEAVQYGLTVEQLKEHGITDPKKVKALASLFGKPVSHVEEPAKQPIKVDSGQNVGGADKDPYGMYARGEISHSKFAELTKK